MSFYKRWYLTVVLVLPLLFVFSYQACSKQAFEAQIKKVGSKLDPMSISGLVLGDNSSMASTAVQGKLQLDSASFVLVGKVMQSGVLFDFNSGSSGSEAVQVTTNIANHIIEMNSSISSSELQKQQLQSDFLQDTVIIIVNMHNHLSEGKLFVNGFAAHLSTAAVDNYYDYVERNYKIDLSHFQLLDVVAYDHTLTTEQVTGVTNYFAEKWSVAVGDPSQSLVQQPNGSTSISYAADVQPIFQAKCFSCHQDVTVTKSISQIQSVVSSGQMAGMDLMSKTGLTVTEKNKILSWIQSGANK